MERDTRIFDIIEREHQRQKHGIELIASENFVSDQVMQAMGSCLTNKYAEGYPGHRYYGGCQVVDEAEQLAIDRVKEIFGAAYANVQPHSGAQANMAVFMACLKPGDKFLGLNLSHGGHLSHGSPVNFSGLMFEALEYNVKEDTGLVDYDQMEEVARRERPKLIIGGASAYSREWDYARMRRLADEIGAILWIAMPVSYCSERTSTIPGVRPTTRARCARCRHCSTQPYSPVYRAVPWNTLSQQKPWHSPKLFSPLTRITRLRSRRMQP